MAVPEAPTRLPLSRDRIAEAALVLVDTDGLDALSMRKLGAALGVEAMSLYNHVRNKDDLLGAIGDVLYTRILERCEGDPDATWQVRARAIATAYWDVSREHPNAFSILSDKPVDSVLGMEVLARCVELFRAAGLSVEDAATAFHAAAGWVIGTIEQELNLMRALRAGAGFSEADVPPALRLLVDFKQACLAQPPDDRFAVGLDIMLAGIEAWIATRPPVEAP
jgi:AcrR family transcriptional regulator